MATIAEKSRTKEIIDRLQSIIDSAPTVPLASGKVSVYKDEMQSLLTELATQMENELKTYHEVNDRKGKIISEAKKEAEKIIYQAEHSASRMRVTKRATGVAPLDFDTLNEEERSALGNANEIYGASLIYTDEMLAEVTDMINDAYQNIRSDYEIILQVLEEKLNTINSNRAELMDGLREMDEMDHSQQILEIGQLLSSELYMSRMKAKMNSDEYDDGSVQLSLDLQEEQEEKARQAEEKAQRAEMALAQMTAERDALAAKVEKMKNDEWKAAIRMGASKTAPTEAIQTAEKTASVTAQTADAKMVRDLEEQSESKQPDSKQPDSKPSEEDVEYEIVYVTEDELEEGEEYEIEYVDDDELEEDVEYEIEYVNEEDLEEGEEYEIEYVDEDPDSPIEEEKSVATNTKEESVTDGQTMNLKAVNEESAEKSQTMRQEKSEKAEPVEKAEDVEHSEEVKEAIRELEALERENEPIPLIPHFMKSESVAKVPSEKVAKMAKAITTDEKYSGLISRAVKQREKAEEEAAVSVEPVETVVKKQKDEDIKTDAEGNEYVQATMQFDDNFEILEF